MRLRTKLLLLGFLILLINSAYLISFGEPTLFYIGNVLIHIVLGVALIVPFMVYVCKRFAGHVDYRQRRGDFTRSRGDFGRVPDVRRCHNAQPLAARPAYRGSDGRDDPICRVSVDLGETSGGRVFTQSSASHRDSFSSLACCFPLGQG